MKPVIQGLSSEDFFASHSHSPQRTQLVSKSLILLTDGKQTLDDRAS